LSPDTALARSLAQSAPSNAKLHPMNKKTVVIVGGGTAGLTIASQLQQKFNVIVLEKSAHRAYPLMFGIPLMIGFLFRSATHPYISKRELQLNNGRVIPFFESCVLGGASPINGCVHTVGSRTMWESMLQRFGAGYADVLAAYKRLYTQDRAVADKIHLMLAPQNAVDHAFLATLGKLQVPVGDMNFSDQQNCGRILNTTRRIFRSSVLSLLRGKALDVRLGHTVEYLLFDGNGRVCGVATRQGDIAADHVILAGGVIGTCSFLLQEKRRAGTAAVAGIGQMDIGGGLQDHTNLRVNVITNQGIGSLNEISRSLTQKMLLLFRHCLGIPTLMVGTGASSAVHLDLNGDGLVDTRIQVVQFTETGRHGSDGKYFDAEPGFSFSITPINPESRGSIALGPDGLQIKPQYLADARDVELLKSALTYCLRLLRTDPLSGYVKTILNQRQIEDDPETYIRDNIFSGHHLAGGVQDAVDRNFQVKGVNGLYVCDASILDGYAASNIHSSVVIIADIFSQRFLNT
jgi:choline dehydrogenase-like flavoprotein